MIADAADAAAVVVAVVVEVLIAAVAAAAAAAVVVAAHAAVFVAVVVVGLIAVSGVTTLEIVVVAEEMVGEEMARLAGATMMWVDSEPYRGQSREKAEEMQAHWKSHHSPCACLHRNGGLCHQSHEHQSHETTRSYHPNCLLP